MTFKVFNSIAKYYLMETELANLKTKLHEAKEKYPARNFAEQEKVIDNLNKYHEWALEMAEEHRLLNKMLIQSHHVQTKLKLKLVEFIAENKKLKIENDELKQNIPI